MTGITGIIGIVKANFKKIICIIWAVYTCPYKRSSIKYINILHNNVFYLITYVFLILNNVTYVTTKVTVSKLRLYSCSD